MFPQEAGSHYGREKPQPEEWRYTTSYDYEKPGVVKSTVLKLGILLILQWH